MIARLCGTLIVKRPPHLLIDVGGVGYELQAPMCTFYALPEAGAEVTVLTHLLVRDDAHILYAFAGEYDRALFREVLKVSGVGAKTALAILSGMEPGAFRECVEAGDAEALARLPGIGRKTAERLIVEMKNRFDDEFWQAAARGPSARGDGVRDAREALVALGYRPADAKRMVKAVETAGRDTEQIIRDALKSA